MQFVKRYAATLGASALAIVILSIAFFTTFDPIQFDVSLLEQIEGTKLDDIVVALVLVVGGVIIDWTRLAKRKREEQRHASEQLLTFKATMRTVQDIVNNALNNLQLVRLEADALPPSTLTLFDSIIRDTATELRVLGDMEQLVERPMAIGAGVEVRRSRDSRAR